MPAWYNEKWVCLKPRCNAIHWYRPKKCSRCGYWLLGRRDNKMQDQELRLEIDELKLERELKIQAPMVRTWSENLAEAQAKYDEAKATLEVSDAELSIAIRKDPEKFGIDKVTESTISALITTHPEHKINQKRLIQARYNLDLAKAAVNGLQDKKRALTLLTDLYVHNYYSEHTLEPKTEKGKEFEKERIRSSARRRRQEEDDDE